MKTFLSILFLTELSLSYREDAFFGVALTSGNMRAVIILPDGTSPTTYTYRVDYTVPFEGNLVLASQTFRVTGVTLTAGISTTIQ